TLPTSQKMSQYSEVHRKTAGPGDERPTALEIIKNEGLQGQMKDKVFLITGCSSGIGLETGRAIAETGARVFLAVRCLEKGQTACSSFLEPGRVELLLMDTSSLSSVRNAAASFLEKSPTLNVLICNAGIMLGRKREESVDGFELQLATNYLGHFLLFELLKGAMIKASTPDFNSRLVNVSSASHHFGEIHLDDFNLRQDGAYEPNKAYAQSKLALIYMSNFVDRHYGPLGLHSLALMPGGVWTDLQQHLPEAAKEAFFSNSFAINWMKSPEQGAATTVLAAVSREWEGRGGKYLENCTAATTEPVIPGVLGVKMSAYDKHLDERLWRLTLETLGLENAPMVSQLPFFF
ncbi:Dehydrogenase/reductase SDR family member on chromosome X, partial [Lachnellula arida]